jgi:hypothetical protein
LSGPSKELLTKKMRKGIFYKLEITYWQSFLGRLGKIKEQIKAESKGFEPMTSALSKQRSKPAELRFH